MRRKNNFTTCNNRNINNYTCSCNTDHCRHVKQLNRDFISVLRFVCWLHLFDTKTDLFGTSLPFI